MCFRQSATAMPHPIDWPFVYACCQRIKVGELDQTDFLQGPCIEGTNALSDPMSRATVSITALCRCGQVEFHLEGPPIMRVACYCSSCQAAAHAFVREFGPPPVVADNGGTDLVLYRKDRVAQISGGDWFRERRLTPESSTRRMVATCCGTPMMMDFAKGHWLSFYR